MGPEVNSDTNEMCASVSPDGKFLFFSSARCGNGDIYWIDTKIIDEQKYIGTQKKTTTRQIIKK